MREGCPLSPHLFNMVLKFLARVIRQEEKTKKEYKLERKSSNYPNLQMTRSAHLGLLRPKKLHQNLLHSIYTFWKIAGCKINLQKSVAVLYTNNEQTEKEYRKIIPFTITSK
jgi:hypothetical protein